MEWIQLTIRTTTEGAEVLTAVLMDLGIDKVSIEDRADITGNQRPEGQWDIIDDAVFERMEEAVKVVAYFAADERAEGLLAAVRARLHDLGAMDDLGLDLGALSMETERIDEEDWAANWKTGFEPFRLGAHFVVIPSWCEFDLQPGDVPLYIDPGMAFGTGTHETTAMCVALIEQYVKPGDALIDIGTGSGILALAAAKMGARDVLAIDLDPVAVRVAAENIGRNGAADRVRAVEGDLLTQVDEVADVVVANIIAEVIVDLAAPVRAHIAPGGLFICSGISSPKLPDVLRALESAGYIDLDLRRAGEWAAIAARNPR